MQKQFTFQKINWKHRFSHGSTLRKQRAGRKSRPLSSKESIHLILKANKECIRGGFRIHRRFALIHKILRRYQTKFFIKIDVFTIQGDHIHLLIRTSKRSNYQSFFRVFAGQIAQQFKHEGLLTFKVTDTPRVTKAAQKVWKYRPFTRVIKGWRAYQIVRNYIQLNEKEALKQIPYRKQRLKGLSAGEWEILWS